MSGIPVNRKYAAETGLKVSRNVGSVAAALSFASALEPPLGDQAGQDQRRNRESQSTCVRVGSFAGSFCGVSVGLALGAASGIIAGPLVAYAVIAVLAIAGAVIGGQAGASGGSFVGIAIGAVFGGALGGGIGTWLGAYIVLATPVIGALFGAYHGGVMGLSAGRDFALRSGAQTAVLSLAALSGLALGTVWVGVIALGHRVSAESMLMFLLAVTSCFIAVCGGTGVIAIAVLERGRAGTPSSAASAIAVSISASIAIVTVLVLPQPWVWFDVKVPKELLRNWTQSEQSTTTSQGQSALPVDQRSLKVDANVREGPGTKFPVRGSRGSGTTFKLLYLDSGGKWVKARFSDGLEGFVSRKLVNDH